MTRDKQRGMFHKWLPTIDPHVHEAQLIDQQEAARGWVDPTTTPPLRRVLPRAWFLGSVSWVGFHLIGY